MIFWDACVPQGNATRSTEFDVAVPAERYAGALADDYTAGRVGASLALTTEQICQPRYRHSGLCARSVVSMLTPMLLNKLLIEGFAMPLFKICLLWPLQRAVSDSDDKPEQPALPFVSFLTTSVETGIVLGPFVPILVPILLLACLVSLLCFHVASRDRRFVMTGTKAAIGPNWFLLAAVMLGQILALLLAYDNDETYYDKAFLSAVAGLLLIYNIVTLLSVEDVNRDESGEGVEGGSLTLANPMQYRL